MKFVSLIREVSDVDNKKEGRVKRLSGFAEKGLQRKVCRERLETSRFFNG